MSIPGVLLLFLHQQGATQTALATSGMLNRDALKADNKTNEKVRRQNHQAS